jgi:glycosyltransferase involved in cell wall biosynthesis
VFKILYLHTTSEIGGSDVSLVRLVEGLDPARYQAVVVLPSEGPLVARLRDAGAVVHVMPALLKLTSRQGRRYLARFGLNMPRAVRALAALIRREQIALVHTNTIHNLYGGPAARLAGVPHVWHIREIVWQYGSLRALELFMVRHLSTRIIVTSEAVAAMFGPPGERPASLVMIANGIEVERFRPHVPGTPRLVRQALGVADDEPLVGIVCRLDMWKGVDVFLDAAARVAAVRPRVQFVVVGGAIIGQEAYARSLEMRAETLGLSGRVRFTGWTYGPAAMPEVHRALDVLVLASSEPEPFGLVVVEAMATGVPVVATAHGGPADIVVDGVTGTLVPPRDPAAMAAAICALVDDPAAAARMGAAGRVRACERYSAAQYLAGVQAVYADVLGAAPAAGARG